MANHKSTKKRARQTKVKNMRNKTKVSRLRTYVKSLRTAIEAGEKENSIKLMTTVQSLAAKLGKSTATKKKTTARFTGKLASQVAKLA